MGLRSILAGFCIALATTASAAPQLRPASYVDLNRYQGVWYEIASLPQIFQFGCSCTKAEYTLQQNGEVKVVNSCLRFGRIASIEGRAVVANPTNQAELVVTFPVAASAGRYVILHVDADYRYAVVASDSEMGGLWILSRTRQLEPALLQEALSIARSQMDIGKIQFTDQNSCD